ncbi:MAG TPA: metalloregulator ArsR/SmtB family transcription factor [Solirubrobacterales bacterium]|nr:metalloregulator ArsR/SmtB family transcription factor [Solirubrobacterales bacterium]
MPQPRQASSGAPGAQPVGDAEAGAVFAALADPTRRHLVAALAERGGATATGLAAELPISRQAVAKHLATLGRAGLVSESRRGREHRFELDPRPLANAAAWLTTVGAEWDARLADLQRLLNR